jgi:galactokinase
MTDDQVIAQFDKAFGQRPDVIVRSPGRVNLIGEHTDYNDGWALPMALDLGTDVVAARRDDRILRVAAPRLGAVNEISLDRLNPRHGSGFARYVAGTAVILGDIGCPVPGADLLIDGNLPIGAGLSSSASLELGVAVAIAELADYPIDSAELPRLGQRVENDIIGLRSGIMDQFAVAHGIADHALRIDCRSLQAESVPIPSALRVLVLDSGVPRSLAESAYNQRRKECEAALLALRTADPSLKALRDVTATQLGNESWRLSGVQLRRARHVVTENQRVLQAAAALRSGDARRFGQLLSKSHLSLRDDYEVSCSELDALVNICTSTAGVLGARLTGAGFGGCVIAIAAADRADRAVTAIAERYRRTTGLPGAGYICTASAGTHIRWTSEARGREQML